MELKAKARRPCAIDRKLLRSYTTEVPLLITPTGRSSPYLVRNGSTIFERKFFPV